MRRQLTLFLPPDQGAIVDPLRLRLDPRQHALIRAHVTLCRDEELVHWRDIGRRLANLGEFSITLRFGLPQVASDGGVLLRPTHGAEQYQRLRRSILGPTAREHGAHITLLHPRHSAGAIHDMAGIAPALADLTVTFRRIALIRQCGSEPWSVQREYGGAA